MRIRVGPRHPAFAAAFALLAVSKVDACRCLPLEVCDGVEASTVVVRAEALTRSDEPYVNEPVTYTVRTLTLFKYPTDEDERPEEITFTTAGNGGACGVTLEIGSEYLLGFALDADGELTANSCGLYRSWSGLTDDEVSLLETNCFDSNCDGNCVWGSQACVLMEGSYSCADTVCDASLCDEDESCSLEEWDCVEEPCPAIATCSETCNRECEEGETCILNYNVACIWQPCAPIPQCVEVGGEEDDPCDGACTEFQDCLLFESSSSVLPEDEQDDDEVWYCADFCGPDNCPSEGEVCELLPVACAMPFTPCPPEAVCQQQCDPECDENQECMYYDFIGFSCEFDTCDPSPCAANETCTILESYPPIVVCSDRCEDLECGAFQECLVNAEGTEDEEPYCADTCAAGTCGDDQTCILEQVQCVRAPCPPFAVCTDAPTPAPTTEAPAAGGDDSAYMGCFKDSKGDRVLSFQLRSSGMTNELCLDNCAARGGAYAGTQYGHECWCYVSGRSDFDRHGSGAVCDMPCHGDEEEMCGGFYAVSLYKLDWPAAPVDDPEYAGCYRDDRSDRVMTDKITRDDMTPAVCREHCLDNGARFYGTQHSSECWCGSSDSISDYDRHGEGVCHLECSGEADLACGGNYAFDLFQF